MENLRGIALMIGGMAAFAVVDLMIKLASRTVPVVVEGEDEALDAKKVTSVVNETADTPISGDFVLVIDDEDITNMGEYRLNRTRRKIGMLFQNAALFDSMTVAENVRI